MNIQQRINTLIMQNSAVNSEIKPYAEAIREGAQALFGEKYGTEVRVISIADESRELCGGTHVERSGDIGLFLIVSESSVASGVRRIEAVTGVRAYEELKSMQKLMAGLKEKIGIVHDDVLDRISHMGSEISRFKKENSELKNKLLTLDLDAYFDNKRHYNGHPLYVNKVDVENMDQLKVIGDKVREKMKSGIAVFLSVVNDMPQVLCVVSDDLVKEGVKAGNLVKLLGRILGGGGGGKPHMATAGGKDPEKLNDILMNIESILQE
jgi:alanyl-tRNA synthetase